MLKVTRDGQRLVLSCKKCGKLAVFTRQVTQMKDKKDHYWLHYVCPKREGGCGKPDGIMTKLNETTGKYEVIHDV